MIKGEKMFGRLRGGAPRKRLLHIPGQVILRIKEDAVLSEAGPAALKFTSSHAKRVCAAVRGPLEFLRKNAGMKTMTPLFSKRRKLLGRAKLTRAARAGLSVLSSVMHSEDEDMRGLNIVELDPKKVTADLMKTLRASESVEIAEPMPARWMAATADPMQNLQWGLRAIRWFATPSIDATSVRVGVMDTGFDASHPDLAAVPLTYHRTGLSARDLLGHGTHVTGTIAATVNNAIGIAGVAQCEIEMWKIFDDTPDVDGEFYVNGTAYLRALNDARTSGIRVLNLSIGGGARSDFEQDLFRRLKDADVVTVAAMGNEYQEGNPTSYPAAYKGVFAVGAVNEALRRSSFSNTGRHIDIVAPESNILSTLPMRSSPELGETEYGSWSGTSMATPHVAAAAAIVASVKPKWSARQIKQRLRSSARTLPRMKGRTWTRTYGSGLLDLKKATR